MRVMKTCIPNTNNVIPKIFGICPRIASARIPTIPPPVIRRIFTLLMSMVLLIAPHGVAAATPASQIGPQDTLTITYSAHRLNPAQQRAVNQFIRQVNRALAPAAVRLAISGDQPGAVHLRFSPRFYAPWSRAADAGIRLTITLNTPALQTVSPVLYAHPRTQTPDAVLHLEGSHTLELTAGILLYAIGRCDLAEPYLWPLLLDDSSTVYTAGFHLAACALIAGEYPAALVMLNTILYIQDQSRRPEPAINLAWLYLTLGHRQRAFNVLEQTYETFSAQASAASRVDFLTRRAQLYALGFAYDAAIADVDAAIGLRPDDPTLHVLRGQMVILLYEWDRVLENYTRALEIDPLYADAYYFRGVLYYSVLAREEALTDFERYVELAPQGAFTGDAARYIESIRAELDALGD